MSNRQYEYSINKATSAIIGLCARVIVTVLFLVLLYLGIHYGFAFGRSIFYADPVEAEPGQDREITITEYDTYESLAQKLYESGVISSELSFVTQATLYDTDLVAGVYTLNTSQTIRDMLLYIDETGATLAATAEAESQAIESAGAADEVVTGGGEGE